MLQCPQQQSRSSNSSSNSSSSSGSSTYVLLQRPSAATVHRFTLLQYPRPSKNTGSTISDILTAASQATEAAALIPGLTSIHTERPCNVRSEDVPCLALLHEVAPVVPSAGRTRTRPSCCLRRREGKERPSVHPQRYQGFDPTFTPDTCDIKAFRK